MRDEVHKHGERRLLQVRSADQRAKDLRDMIEREKHETELADQWVREHGGWNADPGSEED